MPTYQAPVEDGLFLLRDVLRVQTLGHLPGFDELSPEFCADILQAAARIHEDLLHPLNLSGDEEGAHFKDGQVRTPKGFREAWATYCEAGWPRLTVSSALGGTGLPMVIGTLVGEMRTATSHSFSMYGAFAGMAARMLSVMGTPWMHEYIVPHLVSGDWTATMSMTESGAGTDLRQIRTRAIPQPDGSWRINGGKIFISGGDHDLTDNIIHVVLAKVPDENGRVPDTLAAVSAFIVSKRMIDPQTGAVGEPNQISVTSIEHKMGIGGSATCVMNFDNAVAWRLSEGGSEGSTSNMAAMFMLMNAARLGTAMSGVAYAEIARQNAADYARQRMAGRAPGRIRSPGLVADPIVAHPDVRRLLMNARAFTEGARASALRVALFQAVASSKGDLAERAAARDLVELLQPVMKAYFTDKGFQSANDALQVLGGHGYIREYGLEHFVRNSRIGQIYEGANGIQALDFLQRRLPARDGQVWAYFCGLIRKTLDAANTQPSLSDQAHALNNALETLESTVQRIITLDPSNAAGGAYDMLTATGIVVIAWNWLEIGMALLRPEVNQMMGEDFTRRKQIMSQLWMAHELPLVSALCARATTYGSTLMAIPDEWV